jgi:hypothetical protein
MATSLNAGQFQNADGTAFGVMVGAIFAPLDAGEGRLGHGRKLSVGTTVGWTASFHGSTLLLVYRKQLIVTNMEFNCA